MGVDKDDNATFHLFKPSGKWAYSERGYASFHLWENYTHRDQRLQVLADNGDKMPGINGQGYGYNVVVIPDDNVEWGWPLHINAVSE